MMTRILCTAVYLDRELRNRILAQANSSTLAMHDIDGKCVLYHCRRVKWWDALLHTFCSIACVWGMIEQTSQVWSLIIILAIFLTVALRLFECWTARMFQLDGIYVPAEDSENKEPPLAFKGIGKKIAGWSFSVRLRPGVQVDMCDLYSRVERELSRTGVVDMDSRFLRWKGYSGEERPYMYIRVARPGNRFILSVLLRFVQSGDYIITESQSFLIPPLKQRYMNWQQNISIEILQIGLRAVIIFLAAPVYVFRDISMLKRKDAHKNDGPSIREIASDETIQCPLQAVDCEQYQKLIDKYIVEISRDFLREYSMDLSVYDNKKDTIINQGILVTGGSLQAHQVAAGYKAGIWLNKIKYL